MADQEDVDMTTPQGDSEVTTTNDGSLKTTSTSTSQQQRRITSRNPQWTYFKLQLYVGPLLSVFILFYPAIYNQNLKIIYFFFFWGLT